MAGTYKSYSLEDFGKDLSGLVQTRRTLPDRLAEHDVLVRVHAVSLNARDLQIASGVYPAPHLPPKGIIPCSDCAGVVEKVGDKVDRVRPGDRIVSHLSYNWVYGEIGNAMQKTALGGGIDGVLAQYAVLNEDGVVHIPDFLPFAEASTLPVAALTSYHCLFGFERTVQPGQAVLIEGTGGCSIAALQLSLFAGARPIVISSSDDKLLRVQQLGVPADDCINYKTIEDWESRVRELTGGRGVDHTIEIGGRSTLPRAVSCTAPGGCVWVIGPVSENEQSNADLAKLILYSQAVVRGVVCGSRLLFEQMIRNNVKNVLTPIVDRRFAFDDAKAAFQCLESGKFFGKIVIDVA
ncbi:chaperonin 10-like protein [Schizophyllum amplum]|uniref:Chaperonin 10-like protein n=1 Tax=Schizophyllum amplum TaxID=97359 RepID=A0A550CZK9_9AGAR|nr:chaperonin 10-like protein [Auriculariopsis ampla]